MTRNLENFLGALAVSLGLLCLAGALIALAAAINAVVLSILWGWFLTPLYGLPVPPWPGVIGLSVMVSWFTTQRNLLKNHEHDWRKAMAQLISQPLYYLLIGRIAAGLLGTA